MNRIVVTGGAGRLGRRVISDLIDRDYEVSAVDIVAADDLGCPFQQMDLTDRDAVCRALEGAEAVLHLGAVPGPTVADGPVTFRNNVLSTYNVVEVAADFGLSKIVFASSLFTIGWAEDARSLRNFPGRHQRGPTRSASHSGLMLRWKTRRPPADWRSKPKRKATKRSSSRPETTGSIVRCATC